MVAKKIAQFRLTLFRVQRAGWVWFERLAGRNRIYFWTPVESYKWIKGLLRNTS